MRIWISVFGMAIGCASFCSDAAAQAQLLGEAGPIQSLSTQGRDRDAAATLVVYNGADPEAEALASFYAQKRGIPQGQVLRLTCSLSEEITREEYDRTIADPVRRAFTVNFWWKLRDPESALGPVESNKIRFIALMRGLPLKIAQASSYPGDGAAGPEPVGTNNSAAVDSELATLGAFARGISGARNNLYYRSFTPIADAPRPELMLVCRLDGPTAAIVRRMILDGIATEQEGLAGLAYIDARGLNGGTYEEGDEWLRAAATTARRGGMPVVFDNGPELFPEGYPMRRAAIYYGWYADPVSGPFTRPGFRFARGAVAVHIHSFSGSTVRDPASHWVGPLLAAGAAATLGNVYEPYLTLTPHLDIFHDRLRAGLTFAEAAYMSQRVLSWMTTFVGDPLYRPFKGAGLGEEQPASGEWAAYRKGAKLWLSTDRAGGEAALKSAGKKLRSGAIFEGLGLLALTVDDRAAAIAAFRQAREFYVEGEDVARVAIHEIVQLRNAQRPDDALALTRKMLAAYAQTPAAAVLRLFDDGAAPPPR